MKFGSLFTGVGGFDLGFERAGMKCEWQVEFDKNCQNILRKHWSETELFDDVRTVGKHNLKPVDVICGGFPCQDVSIAGKRKGLAGERSGLWSEFARIIDELEPDWVVIENVPGLLSSHRGRDFATVIRWLAERGYGVAWRILDSQYFGVAQRRRRVFIIGSLGNGGASEILFEREGVRWDIEKGRKTGEGVASTFTIRTGKEGGGKGYLGCDDGAMTLGGQPQWVSQVSTHRMTAFGEYSDDDKASALKQRDSSVRLQDKTSPSVSATWGMGGNNMPFAGVRRLTPTECERLQGFPDGWTEHAISDIIDVEILLGETLCQLVQSTDVKEKLSTEIHHFALCTTSDGKSGEVQMLPIQMTEKTQGNVKLKIVIDLRSVVNYVCGTISRGKDMATQFDQTKTLLIEKEIESQDVTSIVLLLSAKLEGNLPRKKLFIISTWIEEIIEKKIYMFLKTNLNTQKLTELSISVSKGLCASELLCLRMGLITQNSDSHRYKQMGNAVTVNVAEWIGKRINQSETQEQK
ncbi:MAG: DNA cytosine methyltransferase [Clostridiaceae bacterium]|nr:DNA cytosine methyltransferase [Clostridiaceae bacterium]